jgi:alpha-L-rhamnosidase
MMRRTIRTVALASALVATQALADPLRDGFDTPPNSAKPRVWWHWMNGNVTIDGIDKDLDWLARIGIGGVQNFDASLNTPQIVEKRLVYMTPEWKAAFKHAVQTAEAKGLEFAIASSPGWSETGGPWVKPDEGMKKLVWSETVVTGGKRFSGMLAPLPVTTGPWQDVVADDPLAAIGGKAPDLPKAGGPAAVVAVRIASPPLPAGVARTADGTMIDWAALNDAPLTTTVKVPTGTEAAPGSVTITFPRAVTARSLRLFVPHARPPFGDPLFRPVLEAQTATGWTKLGEVPLGEAAMTIAFPATTAVVFRLTLAPNAMPPRIGLGDGAPGAQVIDIFARKRPEMLELGELKLSSDARIDQSETKAGYATVGDYHAIADRDATPALAPGETIDLTTRVRADGTIDWTPPKGSDWRIYRFGWSLTGKTNHPATAEATGLEVDKYDAGAVRRYIETYLGMYRDAVGPDLMGAKGIRALLTDSIEVGASNWTPAMLAEFKARRGYDAVQWLPALTGEVIGSRADSERFLYDWRRTLAELLADAHYGTIAKVAKEHGLTLYGEALEDGRPVLGDDLAMRARADVPMAALWTWNRGGAPRPTLLGDMKGAASVAHVYGQNLVAAESMTSANAPWAFAPHDLKRVIDLEFAYGINRPIIHTSVHQPVDDKVPGLSLLIFGQYFNRHESWAEMAKPWVDYMARTSYLLQQGRNAADVAIFHGEEAPLTALYARGVPAGLPVGYAYDFVNADMLRDALSVEGGEIVAKGGARYRAIALWGSSRYMTLPTLTRLAAMVEGGATLIGEKPLASPSKADDAVAFAALADRLWSNPNVIARGDIAGGLAKAGVAPDFDYKSAHRDAEILFVHRKIADGDIYFLNNRKDRAERLTGLFRVAGKRAEIWRAYDGSVQPVETAMDESGSRMVTLALHPEESIFVVFRDSPVPALATLPKNPLLLPVTDMIASPWRVTFQPGRGAPAGTIMKTLQPLNENADAGIKYFSGLATYNTNFVLPKGVKPGQSLQLDLGAVGDVAEVRVNGKAAGTLWLAPWRLEIGKFVKPGRNALEVRVANLWVNRLIGDKQPGATKLTSTAAPTYRADAPLRPSGLMGPVTLSTIDKKQ